MGSAFHQLSPKYLTATAPTAIRLWETFTFFLLTYLLLSTNEFFKFKIEKSNLDEWGKMLT